MGLSVLAGVMWFTATADIDLWPLAWLAMVPLLFVIHDKRPRKAFWYAMLAGTVANFGGFYWIAGTLVRFANLPLALALLLCLLLAFYQALVFGLFAAGVAAVLERRPRMGATFLAPTVVVAAELILPMEFPFFLAITQAWIRPAIQIADLAGPLGVSFVLVMTSGALFDLLQALRRKEALPRRRLAIAAGILVFVFAYGFIQIARYDKKIASAPKIQVAVIQANLGIRVKGRAAFAEHQLGLHHHLSLEAERLGADLIVWPESTHPFPMSRDHELWGRDFFALLTRAGPRVLRMGRNPDESMLDPATVVKTPMLVGVQTNQWGKGVVLDGRRHPEKIFNSVALIDSSGRISGLYDKMYLVKFSEQIPFYDLLVRFKSLERQFRSRHMSNFSPGAEAKALPFGSYRLGPMVCFEDILPELGRRIAAEKPNAFINITNDAWFGETAEPYQHLALAVFRTIEHRRPMVRAVNTGTSTFIDATGRITVQTPAVTPLPPPEGLDNPTPAVAAAGLHKLRNGVFQSEAWPKPYLLLESVAMMPHVTTLYAAFGWLFGWACLLVSLYLVFLHGRGLRRKLFRYRGDPLPEMDRRGRIRAPAPEPEPSPSRRAHKGKMEGNGSPPERKDEPGDKPSRPRGKTRVRRRGGRKP
jgi:apolipoprotein N-acyltransferase